MIITIAAPTQITMGAIKWESNYYKKSQHLILINIVCFLVNVWLLQTQSCTLFML